MSKKGLVPADKKLGKALVRAAQKYEAQIKSSEASLTQSKASLTQSEVNLQHTVIEAPIVRTRSAPPVGRAFESGMTAVAVPIWPA